MKENIKKVFLVTFGCQMNEYDTEIVRSILSEAGYILTDDESAADIIMLNTCSVRDNAHRKVFGLIHELKHCLKNKPVKIGILGCMASAMKEKLLNDKALKLDFVAGPDSYKKLPQIINECFNKDKKEEKPHDFDLSEFETYADIHPKREKGVNAWLAIMRGCNNFCTFCIVPYARGRERSRSPESIITEAKILVHDGFKQVTLLGQNVNSYKYHKTDFTALIESVSKGKGIERVRFTLPHPKDFPERLIDVMANNPKICKHIHLPLQAGNNRILKIMNRTYTKEAFIDLVLKIRKSIPQIALTTDIIVGFPTETDKEFKDTVKVMKSVEFDSAFIFKYSQREGTSAARNFKDDVPKDAKTERIVLLNKLQKELSLKKNKAHVGQECDVLIEEVVSEPDGSKTLRGRTDGNKLVVIPYSNVKIGETVTAKIEKATPHLLKGKMVSR